MVRISSDFAMRIISWNCNMAFRNKARALMKYDADMYVIQESEELSKLNIVELEAYPTGYGLEIINTRVFVYLRKLILK